VSDDAKAVLMALVEAFARSEFAEACSMCGGIATVHDNASELNACPRCAADHYVERHQDIWDDAFTAKYRNQVRRDLRAGFRWVSSPDGLWMWRFDPAELKPLHRSDVLQRLATCAAEILNDRDG
jgi:hypothetical protein